MRLNIGVECEEIDLKTENMAVWIVVLAWWCENQGALSKGRWKAELGKRKVKTLFHSKKTMKSTEQKLRHTKDEWKDRSLNITKILNDLKYYLNITKQDFDSDLFSRIIWGRMVGSVKNSYAGNWSRGRETS